MNYHFLNYDPKYPPDYSIYRDGLHAVGRAVMATLTFIGESYMPAVYPSEYVGHANEQVIASFAGDLALGQYTELTAQDWASAQKAREAL